MSFIDDIKAKAEEFMGGAAEQATGGIEDVTGQAGDLGEQVQNIQDSVLPGGDQNEEK